jgi:hypothetical protein
VVPGQGFDLPGEDASDPLTSIRQSARALKEKNRMVGGDWDETGAAYFGYGTDSSGDHQRLPRSVHRQPAAAPGGGWPL